MQITKPGVLAIILMTSACASNRGGRQAPKVPLRGGLAEFQDPSYDGQTIKGRVLLGATIDPLVIDGRLIETSDVDVDAKAIRVCGNKDPIGYLQEDIWAPPPRPDEIVTIRPGYWYGRKIEYWLFAKKKMGPGPGPGPECLEVEFVVRALDGREAARVRIHVVRTDKLPAPPEGVAPAAPKPLPSDASHP